MRVTYLSLAVLDLAEIRADIAMHNPDAVQRVARNLKDLINKLEQFPNLGKSGRIFGTRELKTPKIGQTPYIVVYRVKGEQIQILRVLPGMRNIDAILEEGFPEEES